MLPDYILLTRHTRKNLTEEEHYGLIFEYEQNGNINKIGNDNSYYFFHRSCMKPFQLAALYEIIEAFGFTEQEIAVCTASHSGEDFHIKAIRSILNKTGLSEEDLQCPPQEPLNKEARKFLILNKEKPKSIHNNCSGKHAAMLAYCVLKGYDIKTYTQSDNPVQKHILNFTAGICEIRLKDCPTVNDGCTVPVLATPLINLAKGYINLFSDNKYSALKKAVFNNPYYFGGHFRVDSEIIFAAKNTLIAKVGAGNILTVYDDINKKVFITKVLDNDNYSRNLITVQYLKKKNYFKDFDNTKLAELFSDEIKDEKDNIVGKIEFLNF